METLQMRCPRLGGEAPFTYCMKEGGDLPCPRVIRCWEAFLPIEAFLKQRLTSRQWERCFGGGSGEKMASLLALAEAAKRNSGGEA